MQTKLQPAASSLGLRALWLRYCQPSRCGSGSLSTRDIGMDVAITNLLLKTIAAYDVECCQVLCRVEIRGEALLRLRHSDHRVAFLDWDAPARTLGHFETHFSSTNRSNTVPQKKTHPHTPSRVCGVAKLTLFGLSPPL
ncbi:hypothetical protein EV356DRAFT_330705 [Viridothelium virens]|uniref:Uncharacterized protein n=1 Tax=Viridothelium virens TaxID=1048519 RepID=A0A6A6GXP5_VIRVR|nr:hypothetical protein EV356DRAFT_330705 [Viridothelium virens]